MREYNLLFFRNLSIAIVILFFTFAIIIVLSPPKSAGPPVMAESGRIPTNIGGHQNGYALHSRGAIDIRAFGVEERDGEVFLVAVGCDAFDGFQCITLRKFEVKDLQNCSSGEWQEALTQSVKGTFDLPGLFFRVCLPGGYFELRYDPEIWAPS